MLPACPQRWLPGEGWGVLSLLPSRLSLLLVLEPGRRVSGPHAQPWEVGAVCSSPLCHSGTGLCFDVVLARVDGWWRSVGQGLPSFWGGKSLVIRCLAWKKRCSPAHGGPVQKHQTLPEKSPGYKVETQVI